MIILTQIFNLKVKFFLIKNDKFFIKAALKDINLILEESKQLGIFFLNKNNIFLGLNCSLLESIQQILQKSVNKNPEEDFSNVYEIIRNN